jgi:hypothetical protein
MAEAASAAVASPHCRTDLHEDSDDLHGIPNPLVADLDAAGGSGAHSLPALSSSATRDFTDDRLQVEEEEEEELEDEEVEEDADEDDLVEQELW